jgi:hypothetical protein
MKNEHIARKRLVLSALVAVAFSAGTAFANVAPNVTLFGSRYSAPRSLRSNLQWSGALLDNRLAASVDATYSLNLNQPAVVDLNFNSAARFTLGDDGRPVFARSSGIVPATGAIASGEGRIAPSFARVAANAL